MTSLSVTATTLPNVKVDAPVRYIVQSGDTLWDIAELYLTEAWHWPQIWAVNPDI
jgi:nucleoid-associated protein YgaU